MSTLSVYKNMGINQLTLDELIEQLQALKEKGVSGDAFVSAQDLDHTDHHFALISCEANETSVSGKSYVSLKIAP